MLESIDLEYSKFMVVGPVFKGQAQLISFMIEIWLTSIACTSCYKLMHFLLCNYMFYNIQNLPTNFHLNLLSGIKSFILKFSAVEG